MKSKVLILYSWFVRTVTFFLPDIPLIQSFRGWLYSFGMRNCGRRFRVYHNVVLNRLEKIEAGDNVYIACGSIVTGGGELYLGDNVMVGPYVIMATDNHEFNGVSFDKGYVFGKIRVEKNSWIGGNATLLMNTVIPHSSVVAAGSVCNKAYNEPYGIYAGLPARYIKDVRPDLKSASTRIDRETHS